FFPEQPVFLLRLPVDFFFVSLTILLAVVAALFLGLPDLGSKSKMDASTWSNITSGKR
ncbi:unnamed protein product, partial [Staurois parvus]